MRLRRRLMVSSMYQAPKKLRQPSSLGSGTTWKLLVGALQERRQAGEAGLPELPRSGVFVVLQALEPDAGADLVYALADLQIVLKGEQIAAIPDVGGIVGAGRGDGRCAGGGDAAADDDAARPPFR